MNVDLGGGLIVELHEFGGAHSLGDQGILVRGSPSVLFTGDLVEEGTFGVLGDSDSHTVPWIDRVRRLEQLDPELVVPGHGLIGGPERIADYRAYLELAKRRTDELRAAGELSEAESSIRSAPRSSTSTLTGRTRSGPGKRSKTSAGRPAPDPLGRGRSPASLPKGRG